MRVLSPRCRDDERAIAEEVLVENVGPGRFRESIASDAPARAVAKSPMTQSVRCVFTVKCRQVGDGS